MVDEDLMRETLSYEMMMQLAIYQNKRLLLEAEAAKRGNSVQHQSSLVRVVSTPAGNDEEEYKTSREER